MKENKVETNLPDFDDLFEISQNIAHLKKSIGILSAVLTDRVAEITANVTQSEQYTIKNKPPSMDYVKNTYQILGRNDTEKEWLRAKRVEIAEAESELKKNELDFQIMRMQIDVWRTENANQRRLSYD